MKSTRAIMVAVLIAAGSLASCRQMNRRSQYFRRMADSHYRLQRKYRSESNEVRRLYHSRMRQRYDAAAKRPWSFVPNDPPEPHSWRDFPRELEGLGSEWD
jgi:hypothetical protein